jgi:hypothetical protein
MMNFNEVVAFVKSASEHLSIDEDVVFEILVTEDHDFTYSTHGHSYTAVMDARNIWNNAKQFFGGDNGQI